MGQKNLLKVCFALTLIAGLSSHAEDKKPKRRHRTGLRITEPKELTGGKSLSCYPKDKRPSEKDEFVFEFKLETPEKCTVAQDSVIVAGESQALKSENGKYSGTCRFGQTIKFDFGLECKVTILPIVEAN